MRLAGRAAISTLDRTGRSPDVGYAEDARSRWDLVHIDESVSSPGRGALLSDSNRNAFVPATEFDGDRDDENAVLRADVDRGHGSTTRIGEARRQSADTNELRGV